MKYTTYVRWDVAANKKETVEFTLPHFKQVGLEFDPEGMPELQALMLVNLWVRQYPINKRLMYWLA